MLGRALAVCLVALAGLVFVGVHWGDSYQWKPDSLFYETQLLRVQGTPKDEALRRVFGGPLAAYRVQQELAQPAAERRLADPQWVDYSYRFYARRWVVPALGAAAEPWLGVNALRAVSLAGYCLAGLLVYALLALRFSRWTSAVVALGTLALQPLRYWSLLPLTDSFGVAVEAGAMACALLALRGGRWRLALLAGAMLALAFTRDSTLVVVAGLAWVAASSMGRRTALPLAAAIAAALPAPLLFGAPARQLLAYTLNDFRPPADPSWGFIFSRYVPAAKSLVRGDVEYLGAHPYVAVFALGGLLALFVLRATPGDPAVPFMRASVLGAAGLIALAPNYTSMRLELPFVPIAAFGVALVLERLTPVAQSLLDGARGRPETG